MLTGTRVSTVRHTVSHIRSCYLLLRYLAKQSNKFPRSSDDPRLQLSELELTDYPVVDVLSAGKVAGEEGSAFVLNNQEPV